MTDALVPREGEEDRPIQQWKAERRCLTCGGRTVNDLTKAWKICVDCGEEWPAVAYHRKGNE